MCVNPELYDHSEALAGFEEFDRFARILGVPVGSMKPAFLGALFLVSEFISPQKYTLSVL